MPSELVGALVRVPSSVLVELYRGRGTDEMVADVGRGSEMAVDALVVATAIRLGGGLILTHEPRDLGFLAASHAGVRVAAV